MSVGQCDPESFPYLSLAVRPRADHLPPVYSRISLVSGGPSTLLQLSSEVTSDRFTMEWKLTALSQYRKVNDRLLIAAYTYSSIEV